MTLTVLLAITTASAQNNQKGGAPQPPKKMTIEDKTNHMVHDLGLNNAQKAKLLQLNKEYEAKLKGILTAEQYKKYQSMGPGGPGRPGGPDGPGGPGGPDGPGTPPKDAKTKKQK